MQEVFADEGIRVVRRAVPTRVARDVATGQIVVTAEVLGSKQEFRADEILVALGRRRDDAGDGEARDAGSSRRLGVPGVRVGDPG